MRINKISIFILSLWLRCLKIYNIFLCIQVITVFKSGSAASLCSLFMHTEAICGKVIIISKYFPPKVQACLVMPLFATLASPLAMLFFNPVQLTRHILECWGARPKKCQSSNKSRKISANLIIDARTVHGLLVYKSGVRYINYPCGLIVA